MSVEENKVIAHRIIREFSNKKNLEEYSKKLHIPQHVL